jgi:hypothetical protein
MIQEALACLKDSGCVLAEESEALVKRVQAMHEAEAKQAADAKAAAPPEPKKVPGTSLAAALDGYKSLQNLARKVDRRRDSLARAKRKLAEREQEFEQAKKNLEEAKMFLEERELEEAAASREYLQLELAVKASPSSLLEGDPETQAMDATGLVAFKVFADGLAEGVESEPPAFPEALQLVFRKCVAVFGYDKCMGTQKQKEVEPPTGPQNPGPQLPVKPEMGSAVPTLTGGGAAMEAPNPLSPKGDAGGKGPSPATPPLRPESKKQKKRDGDDGDDGMGVPAALPLPAGGRGLGEDCSALPPSSLRHTLRPSRGEGTVPRDRGLAPGPLPALPRCPPGGRAG